MFTTNAAAEKKRARALTPPNARPTDKNLPTFGNAPEVRPTILNLAAYRRKPSNNKYRVVCTRASRLPRRRRTRRNENSQPSGLRAPSVRATTYTNIDGAFAFTRRTLNTEGQPQARDRPVRFRCALRTFTNRGGQHVFYRAERETAGTFV